ncbi:MAG TPA: amino acid ABC transporter permease, partial [Rhodobiaceae bacterium]|nr:amino acid ABC transporter permease [Rhodobiaceae bacterium]
GIVNTFIGLFKDTTLVLIVGIFDLLGQVRAQLSDPSWTVPQGALTGYIFAALVFWVFCFGMSQYSNFMERKLNAARER